MKECPRAIELFAGAGGLSIGFESAGWETIFASDWSEDAVATLLRNQASEIPIPQDPSRQFLYGTDIQRADVRNIDFRRFAGIDAVVGGPPCQAFSSAGKMRSLDDERGQMVLQFVRAVAEARPKGFVMENVRGLVTARDESRKPGSVLVSLIERFVDLGYSVRPVLLNSADFGSYQRRVRLFLMGMSGSVLPSEPAPTHSKDLNLLGLPVWRTLGEFLARFEELSNGAWVRPTPELAAKLASVVEGSGLKSPGVREATRPGGHWGYRQGTFIADRTLPARTVTGASSQDWIRISDGTLRRLTEREVARLQGFPEAWEFFGGIASRFLQIGNAVPVDLGRAVAASLAESLAGAEAPGKATSLVPVSITRAIRYTEREDLRNGASRKRAVSASIAKAV